MDETGGYSWMRFHMRNFSDDELDAARTVIIRDFLKRRRVEASAYSTIGHRDHLQIFLEDIEGGIPKMWLAVIVDVPDLTDAVQAYLTEHFPESAIPPLTVVRR